MNSIRESKTIKEEIELARSVLDKDQFRRYLELMYLRETITACLSIATAIDEDGKGSFGYILSGRPFATAIKNVVSYAFGPADLVTFVKTSHREDSECLVIELDWQVKEPNDYWSIVEENTDPQILRELTLFRELEAETHQNAID